MREPTEDPAGLTFRPRSRGRMTRQGSQAGWIVLTIVGVVVFVLLIRALLHRTSATIGGSATPAPAAVGAMAPGHGEEPYDAPVPRAPAEAGFYPATGMVYRCEGQGGEVSFQSDPCGRAARTTKAIRAPPERVRPRRTASSTVAPAGTHASSAQYARVAQPDPARNGRDAACAQARRSREETLERVGLARSYDLLQRLDAMVNEACK